MHPAFSVIFLTTLIGAGQGLFLALYTVEVYSLFDVLPRQDGRAFYAAGVALALVLLALGLLASFFTSDARSGAGARRRAGGPRGSRVR